MAVLLKLNKSGLFECLYGVIGLWMVGWSQCGIWTLWVVGRNLSGIWMLDGTWICRVLIIIVIRVLYSFFMIKSTVCRYIKSENENHEVSHTRLGQLRSSLGWELLRSLCVVYTMKNKNIFRLNVFID